MTQHNTKDIEAAIELLRRAVNEPNSYETQTSLNLMKKALAKLEPKPEKPREWWITYYGEGRSVGTYTDKEQAMNYVHGGEIVHVRELTATDAPAQKWNMPTWANIPKAGDADFLVMVFGSGDISYSVGRSLYEVIRDKIMAMNDSVAQK